MTRNMQSAAQVRTDLPDSKLRGCTKSQPVSVYICAKVILCGGMYSIKFAWVKLDVCNYTKARAVKHQPCLTQQSVHAILRAGRREGRTTRRGQRGGRGHHKQGTLRAGILDKREGVRGERGWRKGSGGRQWGEGKCMGARCVFEHEAVTNPNWFAGSQAQWSLTSDSGTHPW